MHIQIAHLKNLKQIHELLLIMLFNAALIIMTSIAIHAQGHTSAIIDEAVAADLVGQKMLKDYEQKYERQDQYVGYVIADNIELVMSDGIKLSADVFRPEADGKYPVILTMTPYQKDMPWTVPPDHEAPQGEYQNWESPNPDRWVPKGYVIVRVDVRGSGFSEGKPAGLSGLEWRDFYETIEWAGAQSWSNGNVGLAGISYMAINQWYAAATQPPSLKCIIPWEGLADQYRDSWFVGGILSTAFLYAYVPEFLRDHSLRDWDSNTDYDRFDGINMFWDKFYHNTLQSGHWDDKVPDFSKIVVPLYSVGNWGGWKGAGHLRGNTEGYKFSASEHKRLRIQTGGHQDAYYSEEGFLEQLRFYDRWLLDIDNGWENEAPVKLAVRTGTDRFDFEWRDEQEWPLARTEYQKLYLATPDGKNGMLTPQKKDDEQSLSYNSPGLLLAGNVKEPNSSLNFLTAPFETETEITGEVMANLWLSTTIEDAFPHVTLFKITATGDKEVLTAGRLRASHRALDLEKSTSSRPYHIHGQRQMLTPNEAVELQIEVWPTSMVFEKGSRLLMIVAGDSKATLMATGLTSRKSKFGLETIHMGGQYDSYLQIPVIPK